MMRSEGENRDREEGNVKIDTADALIGEYFDRYIAFSRNARFR